MSGADVLDPDTRRALVRITLDLLAGRLEPAGAGLGRLVRAGASPRALVEWALQLHLFDGVPTSIEALRLLMAELPEPVAAELAAASTEDSAAFPRLGNALFDLVYGSHAGQVKHALGRRSRLLLGWILEHGYGRVLSRPGLATAERELLAVCILAHKGWREQLRAHLRGALACGASRSDLEEVLVMACADPVLLSGSLELVRRVATPT